VRAIEWIGSLIPELPHIYLTSSRDETIDKALRMINVTRKEAQIAIGLDGGYYGHTVASCRSLSDPTTHRGGPGHFNWPRVPHPAVAGTEATINALRDIVTTAGTTKVLGFVYEIVQERTGHVLPRDFMTALAALRKDLDLPLIAVETTTHTYRSGLGAFASPALGVIPDALTWWGGGQTGYIHTSSRWFVPGPLTLVSTWDGDELSLVRQHHQLRAARHLDIATASKALESALGKSNGLGAYRVIDGDKDTLESLAEHHIAVRQFPNGKLGIIPGLDEIEAAAKALGEAL
jgi:4-aminobutyrate aminotransferase-like enzyme